MLSKKVLAIFIIIITVSILVVLYFSGYDVVYALSQVARMASDEISRIQFDRELFWKTIGSIITIFVALIFYKISGLIFEGVITRAGGTEGDVKMLLGLWRMIVGFLAVLAILGTFFQLSVFIAALGAFGGLFLGWALQPMVSGFAAWLQ